MMNVSASRGRAPVRCPACPESDEVEAVAQVGGDADERGSYAILEAFECPRGHTMSDLTLAQESTVLADAREWLADALDAMQSAADDARFDSYREEGP